MSVAVISTSIVYFRNTFGHNVFQCDMIILCQIFLGSENDKNIVVGAFLGTLRPEFTLSYG